MAETPKQSVHGSCHCGRIKYTFLIASATPDKPLKASRCNCTMCQKPGYISIHSTPNDFKLISPASKSELSDYQFRSKDCHRYFCNNCGVQVFGEGKYEWDGVKYDFFSVNLNTIDQPQEGIDLSEFKMAYYNGLADGWMDGEKDRPYPGGTI